MSDESLGPDALHPFQAEQASPSWTTAGSADDAGSHKRDAGRRQPGFGWLRRAFEQLSAIMRPGGDRSPTQFAAFGAFAIRIGSAAIAFLSQPLFARLMGSDEYGIYAYVWTWALLFGGIVDFGLSSAAQRFIPEYRETGAMALLNGFLTGSRWLAVGAASAVAILCALAISAFGGSLDEAMRIPMYIGCATLPFGALCVTQDGIARSYDWIGVALLPLYIIRPIGILVGLFAFHLAGFPATAITIMVATVLACIVAAVGQTLVLDRRLRDRGTDAARAYDFRLWISTSLPISLSVGFFFLLSYVDILVLQIYRPPGDIAIYYAVQKLLALVAFLHFSVAAAAAHRFSEYRATGQVQRLVDFYAGTRRWTFWPSLAGAVGLLVAGWPLLWLFGPDFVAGYPLIAILCVGLLARAAIGPAERLLTMLGRQNTCAMVYLAAMLTNVVACVILVPQFGLAGAAISTSAALVVESVALSLMTRRELARVVGA